MKVCLLWRYGRSKAVRVADGLFIDNHMHYNLIRIKLNQPDVYEGCQVELFHLTGTTPRHSLR